MLCSVVVPSSAVCGCHLIAVFPGIPLPSQGQFYYCPDVSNVGIRNIDKISFSPLQSRASLGSVRSSWDAIWGTNPEHYYENEIKIKENPKQQLTSSEAAL